jgi:glutamate:GABA antiporter
MEVRTASRRFLNVFLLALLNLAITTSLRNLPLVAEYGLSAAFLFCIVALVFLFPCALVSAELATGWTQTGGVYIWVREAFGSRWGFFAIWMQWVHNVTWYPAIMSFTATTLAFVFKPELAANKAYVLSVVLIGFWGMTILNLMGLKISSLFSAFCVIAGTIIPGFFILFLGANWIFSGEPLQISFQWRDVIPEFSGIKDIVFLSGLVLAFTGFEVNAAHAREVKNPQKDYPRSILISALLSFILLSFGSIAISVVIPKEQISLVAGLMDAFTLLLKPYGLPLLIPVLAILIVLGAIGETNAWIIGPVRGLFATSKHGDLPPFFQKLNKKAIPYNLLIFQGIIVTLASFVILFMPTTGGAFWILSALSVQLYLVMYAFMFIAAIRLRYTHSEVKRSYRIPYKNIGMWITASLGFLATLFAFFLAYVPPSQLPVGNLFFYEGFLIIGLLSMVAVPLFIYRFRKPEWYHPEEDLLQGDAK